MAQQGMPGQLQRAREAAERHRSRAREVADEHRAMSEQLTAATAEWQDIRAQLEAERDQARTELHYYRTWLARERAKTAALQARLDGQRG
jgi:predicted  nucleic acid-binding Zn-ribbon protein